MFRLRRNAVGIDIGSSNTTLVAGNRSEILFEPTFVAYVVNRRGASRPMAFGNTAKAMDGKAPPSIRVVRPLRKGNIASFESVAHLVIDLLDKVKKKSFLMKWRNLSVFACVPDAATDVEKRMIKQSLLCAGASRVVLLRKPIVVAIGAGVNVEKPMGQLVVDIGGGTSEISIISLSDLIVSRSLRIGGEDMDEEIVNYLRRVHCMVVSFAVAEAIRERLGNESRGVDVVSSIRVKGRHSVSGMPTEITVLEEGIIGAIMPIIDVIADAIRDTIEQAPPDVMSDVIQAGGVLIGGIARMNFIASSLSERIGISVHAADEPDRSMARGLNQIIDNQASFRHLFINDD
ncbi:hypothetical protein HYN69_19095 (plasmid) [Gemmobacter aquarius]|uniref:Cell shape-determining protein MreB n=1 Tax=Paragemmobacter aquarius TaxID=2169400 RepID=A0A2S0USD4_9RHOB|nr:rod shape-determining protein [Gemmobacter aquarius]AWB50690.1 hypothetical protein HYN69_19095 [Gemmobacter aquarius]